MKLSKLFVALAVMVAIVAAAAPELTSAQGGGTVFPISLDHPAAPFIETSA